MTISMLKARDRTTANGILAAAALSVSSDDPSGLKDLKLVGRYGREADEVLSEIRARLNIGPDDWTPSARRAIDDVLLGEMKSFISSSEESEALARAGQAGKLPPALYNVETIGSSATFESLGIRQSQVVSAVRNPDEYQHLLSRGAIDKDVVSLFLRKVVSRDRANSHWLLVQTHRQQLTQIVQSAWRIYPQDVDISEAHEPIHLLQALVAVFGVPFFLNGRKETFVNRQELMVDEEVKLEFPQGPEVFYSASHALNEGRRTYQVGLIYCINLDRYKASLREHGK